MESVWENDSEILRFTLGVTVHVSFAGRFVRFKRFDMPIYEVESSRFSCHLTRGSLLQVIALYVVFNAASNS